MGFLSNVLNARHSLECYQYRHTKNIFILNYVDNKTTTTIITIIIVMKKKK